MVAGLALASGAKADDSRSSRDQLSAIKLGYYSQQVSRSRANIGASIVAERRSRGGGRSSVSRPVSDVIRLPVPEGVGDDLPDPYPPLDADSPLAKDSTPVGPGSFWYPPEPGRACIYSPDGVAPCYRLVGPGDPNGPALDPAAIAAAAADRLPLFPGRIQLSPQVTGLTGSDSWFWLDPAPRTEELTVSLAGETVTVRATPFRIDWRFGDGAKRSGGPGVRYRRGSPPSDAVIHLYETRCLPSDQGRNPYVLDGCAASGYLVEVNVLWAVTYTAAGPIDASGSLPSRSTATEAAYPVSESRGFLVPGGSP